MKRNPEPGRGSRRVPPCNWPAGLSRFSCRRAFFLALALAGSAPVAAQDMGVAYTGPCTGTTERGAHWVNINGSLVILEDTDEPGMQAQVRFVNEPCNHAGNTGTRATLKNGEVTVEITFTYNAHEDLAGADAIAVEPQAGLLAIPPELAVPETGEGVVFIALPMF